MRKSRIIKTLFAAFPVTVPVMLGYLFIGFAFGVLLEQKGYHFLWAALMSVCVFAGSMQFVTISFLTGGFSLLSVAVMTLVINSRHIFYGLTMLDKFKDIKKTKKAYLIFSLTDETYALLCTLSVPEGADKGWFFFFIALLNQIYWVAGSVIGAVASSLISFNTTGIDFSMTSLFIVLLVEQLRASRRFGIAAIGAVCAVACLIVFGPGAFIPPSLAITAIALIALKPQIEALDKRKDRA
jgi:4-azaleucine resistance transporter AzlC